jgi:hypothetical protein
MREIIKRNFDTVTVELSTLLLLSTHIVRESLGSIYEQEVNSVSSIEIHLKVFGNIRHCNISIVEVATAFDNHPSNTTQVIQQCPKDKRVHNAWVILSREALPVPNGLKGRQSAMILMLVYIVIKT